MYESQNGTRYGVEHAVDADDHLNRLLPPDTEIPWYRSIVENLRDLIHPEKLPPLELTSKPVKSKISGDGAPALKRWRLRRCSRESP